MGLSIEVCVTFWASELDLYRLKWYDVPPEGRWCGTFLSSMSAGGKARGGSAKERSVFGGSGLVWRLCASGRTDARVCVLVGNIPYDVTEEMLKEIFSEAGSVMNFR